MSTKARNRAKDRRVIRRRLNGSTDPLPTVRIGYGDAVSVAIAREED